MPTKRNANRNGGLSPNFWNTEEYATSCTSRERPAKGFPQPNNYATMAYGTSWLLAVTAPSTKW